MSNFAVPPNYRAKKNLKDLGDLSLTQGDILYFDGNNLTKLSPGTNGQYLKTQGAGANPVWEHVTNSFTMDDIANGSTYVKTHNDFTDTYKGYLNQGVKTTDSPTFKSLSIGINIETLSGDKTLTPGTDEMYQYLDPNGSDRVITLNTSNASAGDRFVIRHNGDYNSYDCLEIKQGSDTLDYIYAGAIKKFIFDGTNWIAFDNGTGEKGNKDYNIAIGYYSIGYREGTAIGYLAFGAYYGVGIGNGAWGDMYGVAVGYHAYGRRYGVAVGYEAGYNISIDDVDRYNTLIGAYSGYQVTTGKGNIILGYKSGYDSTYSPTTGSYNILIGHQSWTPANNTSNFLNIGGLIFGTNLATAPNTISTGKVGIGTTSPQYKLDINGTLGFTPGSSVTPVDNGDVVFELTNDTTFTIKAKGSDGVVRSGTITLS